MFLFLRLKPWVVRLVLPPISVWPEKVSLKTQFPADLTDKIDKVATDTLARTGVPSASIAIVKDGQIAYVKAYGDARLEPKTAASTTMRYSIGSIRKLFIARAILLLHEQGKVSAVSKIVELLRN